MQTHLVILAFFFFFTLLTRSCWRKKTVCSQTQRQTMMEFMDWKNIITNICYAYYDAHFIHGQTANHFNFFCRSWKYLLKYRLTNPLIDIFNTAFLSISQRAKWLLNKINSISLKIEGLLRKIWFFMAFNCNWSTTWNWNEKINWIMICTLVIR